MSVRRCSGETGCETSGQGVCASAVELGLASGISWNSRGRRCTGRNEDDGNERRGAHGGGVGGVRTRVCERAAVRGGARGWIGAWVKRVCGARVVQHRTSRERAEGKDRGESSSLNALQMRGRFGKVSPRAMHRRRRRCSYPAGYLEFVLPGFWSGFAVELQIGGLFWSAELLDPAGRSLELDAHPATFWRGASWNPHMLGSAIDSELKSAGCWIKDWTKHSAGGIAECEPVRGLPQLAHAAHQSLSGLRLAGTCYAFLPQMYGCSSRRRTILAVCAGRRHRDRKSPPSRLRGLNVETGATGGTSASTAPRRSPSFLPHPTFPPIQIRTPHSASLPTCPSRELTPVLAD